MRRFEPKRHSGATLPCRCNLVLSLFYNLTPQLSVSNSRLPFEVTRRRCSALSSGFAGSAVHSVVILYIYVVLVFLISWKNNTDTFSPRLRVSSLVRARPARCVAFSELLGRPWSQKRITLINILKKLTNFAVRKVCMPNDTRLEWIQTGANRGIWVPTSKLLNKNIIRLRKV